MDKRNRKETDPAFARVMARTKERLELLGIERAAGPWLAEQLGVTRQLVSIWGRDGIPEAWVDRVAERAGMAGSDIRPPPPVPLDLPPDIMEELVIVSRKQRRSLAETILDLIRTGLKRNR